MTQCFRADTVQHLGSQFWWWVGGGRVGAVTSDSWFGMRPVIISLYLGDKYLGALESPYSVCHPYPLVFLVEAVHGLACAYVD